MGHDHVVQPLDLDLNLWLDLGPALLLWTSLVITGPIVTLTYGLTF